MNTDFVEFLRANINETVWFMTPSGLIFGQLHDFDEVNHVFGLLDAATYKSSVKLGLGDCAVSADDVSAWGMDEPTPLEED